MVCHITEEPKPGYRRCAGIMLLNARDQVFVGRRRDSRQIGWQMPQGGIDEDEVPRHAVLREMREEIGTDKASLLQESRYWRSYDLPSDIVGRVWGGRYLGQTQRWFAFRFEGADADIDVDGDHPEFDDWRWLAVDDLIDNVVSFKRDVYLSVVDEFRHLWA